MEQFRAIHQEQLAQIPIQYHESLYHKISQEVLDASDFKLEYGQLIALGDIHDIYLVDHAWTVGSLHQVEKDARSMPGLATRFDFDMHGIELDLVKLVMEATQVDEETAIRALKNTDWQTLDAIQMLTESLEQKQGRKSLELALGHKAGSNISKTVDGFWHFCSFYKSGSYNLWYITDEVGLAIRHSDTPNVKMIPFLTIKDGSLISYSVFWPIRNIENGDLITRDALPVALQNKLHRDIYSHVVFNVANDSEVQSLDAFKNLNKTKTECLKRPLSIPTNNIDFYTVQKLVLSKYGDVPWISRMYQIPLELAEWNGHYLSDRECAWEILDGSEPIVNQNHAFLIHQLDLGNVLYFRRIEKKLFLYGERRFNIDFLIKIQREEDLEVYISDRFYTRIAQESVTNDNAWKDSVLKTKIWTDDQGEPTPSPSVFLKNYPQLPLQEIRNCIRCTIDSWNPNFELVYITFEFKPDFSPIVTDIGQIGEMDLSKHQFSRI